MPITATLLAGDRSGAYRYLPRSISTFADRDTLAAMMEEAGLGRITRHPMTFGVCVAYLGSVIGGSGPIDRQSDKSPASSADDSMKHPRSSS